jgi:carboxyl-terminal processing protease
MDSKKINKTNNKETFNLFLILSTFIIIFSVTAFSILVLAGVDPLRSISRSFGCSNTEKLAVESEVINIIDQNFINEQPTNEDIDEYKIKGLVDSLNDPYSEYLTIEETNEFRNSLNEKFEGIGIRFIEKSGIYAITEVIAGSPAEKSGIRRDDLIFKVDNENTQNLSSEKVSKKIRGQAGTSVKLTLIRGEETIELDILRETIASELISLIKEDDLAIIRISSFGENLKPKMEQIASEIKKDSKITKIILDLRSNTGGVLQESVNVASFFVDPELVIVSEQYKDRTKYDTSIKVDNSLKDYPLVIAVDSYTASASEIVAGALRDIRQVKLVGEKTYGKGVVQELFPLKNGATLKLTIAKWLTPNGKEIDKIGLEVDVKSGFEDTILSAKNSF